MNQKFMGLLLVSLLTSYLSLSQTTRRYSPEHQNKTPETESSFAREIKKIEHFSASGRLDIDGLITADILSLEQLTTQPGNNIFKNIRQTSAKENSAAGLSNKQSINGSLWEVSTKYFKKGKTRFPLDNTNRQYDLIEVVQVYTLPQPDTSLNFINIEKTFYWLSPDPDYDFAIVYKGYTSGDLKQESRQVYAGKNQLIALNKTRSNDQAFSNSKTGDFTIYPNPTNVSQVTISFNVTKTNTPVVINLIDATGKSLQSFNRNSGAITRTSTLKLDIGQHPSGIYFVQLMHSGISAMKKLVIIK